MNIQKTIQAQLRVAALLLAAFSLIALGGCKGMTDAPSGSTITITPFGIPVILNPVSVPSLTAPTTKTQSYRVSVADKDKLPLNDIDVNFLGQFSNGQSINFGGAIGSATASSAVTLSATTKTDSFGYLLFDITVPYYAQGVTLSPPFNQSATAGTGGSLPDNTYFYTVTSLDLQGESTSFSPISIVLSGVTNSVTGTNSGLVNLSWKRVTGASAYNVYAYRQTGVGFTAIGYLFTVTCDLSLGCADPVTYPDNGSNWPQNTAFTPPTINTTGLGVNGVKGTMQATTGSAIATQAVDF